MRAHDQNKRKPTDLTRGGQPPNPRGFTPKRKWLKDRQLKIQLPVSGLIASSVFQRSGCASAEPYPLKHKFMVAEQTNL